MVSVSEAIIIVLGGLSETARKMTVALGKPVAVSTVQHWMERGYFPHWRVPEVLQTARHFGVPLKPEHFIVPLNPEEFTVPPKAVMAPAPPADTEAIKRWQKETGKAFSFCK